jgi:NitT/TauT family transport system permease protein
MKKQILKNSSRWFKEFFLELFYVFRDFFKLRTTPGKKVSPLLVNLLFLLIILFYSNASIKRHKENSTDKIMPTFGMMVDAIKKAVFIPKIEYQFNDTTGERLPYLGPENLNQSVSMDFKNLKEHKYSSIFNMWKNGETKKMLKNGESRMLQDAIVSGRIVCKAMGLIFLGVFIGLYMGIFAYAEKILYKFVLFFDKVPALAVLPILYVAMGTGEKTKIALIVIGVAPTIILDAYLRVKAVHDEQIVTGLTLGASTPEITYKIVFPQVFPEVLNTIRLNFKSVILFLLAGEAINANAGVGYRIFVAKRTIDMATIIPYVLLISLAAFLVDWAFRALIKSYKWLNK